MTANGLGLCVRASFEAPSVKLRLMFIRSRKVSSTTSAPLLARCCYGQAFLSFHCCNVIIIRLPRQVCRKHLLRLNVHLGHLFLSVFSLSKHKLKSVFLFPITVASNLNINIIVSSVSSCYINFCRLYKIPNFVAVFYLS